MKPKKLKIKTVFEDDRGQILELTTESVHHLGIVTFIKGAIRGKHYHKNSDQFNWVLDGKIELVIKNMQDINSEPETIILEKGDMIFIPSYWYHQFTGLEESRMLFSETGPRQTSKEYEKDTFRIEKI